MEPKNVLICMRHNLYVRTIPPRKLVAKFSSIISPHSVGLIHPETSGLIKGE